MSFCDLCKGLTIEKLYPPNIYYHSENLTALEQSGKNCRLCAFIHWCVTRTDNAECFHLESIRVLPAHALPRLQTNDQDLLSEESDEVFDGQKYRLTKPLDSYRIKLQIIQDPAAKLCSTREDANGFAHVGIWLNAGRMRTDMTLAVEEGDPLGTNAVVIDGVNRYIYGRTLLHRSLSDDEIGVMRDWLKRCEMQHERCWTQFESPPKLPDRVIHVSSDSEVLRLVDGSGLHAQYITLSYCWGKKQALSQTTTSNIAQRRKDIPFDELPKTFKDAVVVCRELRIEYLWIDALCIIQDSLSDWETQSSLMDSIYYNSTLTLMACGALDSTEGLFLPPAGRDLVCLDRAFGKNRGQTYLRASSWDPMIHSLSDSRRYRDSRLGNGPMSRGWTYQEMYLARRLLMFEEGLISWLCGHGHWAQGCSAPINVTARHELRHLEKFVRNDYRLVLSDADEQIVYCNQEADDNRGKAGNEFCRICHNHAEAAAQPSQSEVRLVVGKHNLGTLIPIKRCQLPDDLSLTFSFDGLTSPPTKSVVTLHRHVDPELYHFVIYAGRLTVHHMWYDVVLGYSCRNLTFEEDKLPALAGFAARIQAITDDEYLAGHWRRLLGRSLFWGLMEDLSFDSADKPRRVQSYRAPTWSWASLDGFLSWTFPDTACENDLPDSINVLRAGVEVSGLNPFGRVTGGSITIQASVVDAIWDNKTNAWMIDSSALLLHGAKPSHGFGLDFLDANGARVGFWVYDDVVNGILPGSPLVEGMEIEYLASRCTAPYKKRMLEKPEDPYVLETLWQRATCVPEDLLLVRGPYKGSTYDVLVLARTGLRGDEYKRVGLGYVDEWFESIAQQKTLTVV